MAFLFYIVVIAGGLIGRIGSWAGGAASVPLSRPTRWGAWPQVLQPSLRSPNPSTRARDTRVRGREGLMRICTLVLYYIGLF